MGSKADELKKLIEQAKQQFAATEYEMTSLSSGAPKWSIPDRRIAMRYLLDVVKGGMDPQHWARLHPAEWARLVQVAPHRRAS
jgi:hypothetical protein